METATEIAYSIVVPLYNEQDNVLPLYTRIVEAMVDTGGPYEIVFVDDGSRDGTVSLLEELCRGYEDRAGILQCERNRGKAEAVRRGVLHAIDRYADSIAGYRDADLATPLHAVTGLRRILDERPEVQMVFGSRVKLLGRRVERRAARHYLGRVFATIVSGMLRLAIYDTQCGAKLFRVTPDFRQVFSQPFLSKWVFDVEIVARYLNLYHRDTARLERAIYEYPLEAWVDVAGSKVRIRDFVTAFVDIVRIRKKYLSGARYSQTS